jgi:hypothetical protein
MDLGTFGAILRFAMDWEQRAAEFYEQAARAGNEVLFQEMAGGARKRIGRLEQARREGVAEMILESITGLDGDAYTVALDPTADGAALLRQAQSLEESAARFYRDAAARLPIREVMRLFQRLGQEHESAGQRFGEAASQPG